MVLEHALLPVVAGRGEAFGVALATTRPRVAATPGLRRLRLSCGVERPATDLLPAERDRLEDHTEGLRGSDRSEEWRRPRHDVGEPLPVGHLAEVLGA